MNQKIVQGSSHACLVTCRIIRYSLGRALGGGDDRVCFVRLDLASYFAPIFSINRFAPDRVEGFGVTAEWREWDESFFDLFFAQLCKAGKAFAWSNGNWFGWRGLWESLGWWLICSIRGRWVFFGGARGRRGEGLQLRVGYTCESKVRLGDVVDMLKVYECLDVYLSWW